MTASNPPLLELFKREIGKKIEEVSGIVDVFNERSRMARYPRIVYKATVWTQDSGLGGTLTCTVAGNGTASEVDNIAESLLRELEGLSFCSDELMYYLHSGRISPEVETDKTIYTRIVTFEFITMGG